MGSFYRHCLRPLLFLQDSEAVHNRVLRGLSLSARLPVLPLLADACYGAPDLPVVLAGLKFPNPIGLAAGMDKAAAAVPMWERLGFGFAELGGVTRHTQTGNDTPRMFRAVTDRALVNRMGFNNPGAEAMAEALRGWRKREQWPMHPIGINLGKSKVTPLGEAADDYAFSFRTLQGLADFFVVNVSSPNTPNLRELQDKSALDEILKTLRGVNTDVPLFLKIAPDLSTKAIDDVLDLATTHSLAGIVATNTTIERPSPTDAQCKKIYAETGGLSGVPLRARSTEIIAHIYKNTKGALPIIGVGGIFTADDAWEKITAGASLVQVYTALVYEGPSIAADIVRGLNARMEKEGVRSLDDLVGKA
ncbi:MAG: quinone-dependent dihydroorotate dehydrogenase [Verrucomicrobiota bacterium]|nr:quinone-dependent dihydroorotate dehydrogenase [Verrucomicrobiota bacterium]